MSHPSTVIVDLRVNIRTALSHARSVIWAHSANDEVRAKMERHMVNAAIEEIDKFDVDDSNLDRLESLHSYVASQAVTGDAWCRDVLTSLGLPWSEDAADSDTPLSTDHDERASPLP